ncbi:MAG: alpha/beta hydrolase [Opitutaceae bacterium]|nr:alpha/beta hydrolase [Opitutaceae bacterium]
MKFPTLPLVVCAMLACRAFCAEQPAAVYQTRTDLPYYTDEALAKGDDYQRGQCRLDVYYPSNRTGFPTVIWFHGGGLTGGRRNMPAGLKNQGIAIVSASYRLSPRGKLPCFFEDAAAAAAWTFKNIAALGGDPGKIFISGHSAGGYLAAMIGMDARWLKPHGLSNRRFAGIAPVSAQMTTHFEVKKQLGDTGAQYRPLIDEYAPLYHAAKNLPPVCLITGDRRIEFKSRVEENALLAVSLQNLGHGQVEFYEMGGLDHAGVSEGGALLVRKFIKRLSAPAKPAASSRLAPAPASETARSPWRSLRKLRGLIGTGLAQPKMNEALVRLLVMAVRINTKSPSGSMCGSGLMVMRPLWRAVGSPAFSATQPCATS